jgi:hypothetical protein
MRESGHGGMIPVQTPTPIQSRWGESEVGFLEILPSVWDEWGDERLLIFNLNETQLRVRVLGGCGGGGA